MTWYLEKIEICLLFGVKYQGEAGVIEILGFPGPFFQELNSKFNP